MYVNALKKYCRQGFKGNMQKTFDTFKRFAEIRILNAHGGEFV